MSTIYLISDQGRLQKKGETLQLKMDENTSKTIFPFKTEQLILIGNIELSSPALKLLMRQRINTVFLNKNGRFNGRIDFQMGKNVFLRRKQFRLLEEAEFRLNFARAVVSAKLKNQLAFMQRIKRRGQDSQLVKNQVNRVKTLIEKAATADNPDTLRGYEGAGARAFFDVYRLAINPDFAEFRGRSMNPPQDNVNAVLSFIYTLIYYRVDAALEVEGLDGYVGYFHRIDYGKRSLAFDLMEEYRTPIGDTLTAALFNLGVLNETDFHQVTFSGDSVDYPLEKSPAAGEQAAFKSQKGVLLTQTGLRKVISQFEKKMDTPLFYQPLQKQLNYKQIVLQQVKHFKRVINGEESLYKPLQIK